MYNGKISYIELKELIVLKDVYDYDVNIVCKLIKTDIDYYDIDTIISILHHRFTRHDILRSIYASLKDIINLAESLHEINTLAKCIINNLYTGEVRDTEVDHILNDRDLRYIVIRVITNILSCVKREFSDILSEGVYFGDHTEATNVFEKEYNYIPFDSSIGEESVCMSRPDNLMDKIIFIKKIEFITTDRAISYCYIEMVVLTPKG